MLLEGKTGLVMGVANKRSIAWGITNAVSKAGARVALAYQSERLGENVTELLAELVLAKKLEATEAEIIEAMHPHPTMSEAVMEAAGVADGRAIHL